jgi:glycosyltransferase involved in cell wall biosynthesis
MDKNSKKILRIITRMNVGGPSIHVTLLSRILEPEYETKLVYGVVEASEKNMEYLFSVHGFEYNKIQVKSLKRSINPISDFLTLIKLITIIVKFKPDIVHTHHGKAGMLGRTAAFLSRVPVIIHTYHGHIFEGHFSSIKSKVLLNIERFLSRISTAIIAISKQNFEDFTSRFRICKPEKCYLIPLGFDFEPFLNTNVLKAKQDFCDTYNIKEGEITIAIVGRLTYVKRIELFIETIKYFQKDPALNNKLKFFIVGSGSSKEELVEYSKELGVYEQIIWVEHVNKMNEFFAGIDIVVLTSRSEGTPVSLIEAAVMQCCIISTDVGGIKDFITDKVSGLLLDADPNLFYTSLKKVITDPELGTKYGRIAKENVLKKYDKNRLRKDLLELYEMLISKN